MAPYRKPLFANISKTKGVSMSLILIEKVHPSYPQWDQGVSDVAYKVKRAHDQEERHWIRRYFSSTINLLAILKEEQPNVIICSGFSKSTTGVFLYKLFTGCPYAIWMEGTDTTEKHRKYPHLRTILRRFIAKNADGFIDAGIMSRSYIESLLPKEHNKLMATAYNCVDSDRLREQCISIRSNPNIYSRLKEQYPYRNILFSGRLTEIKGIREMISVYEKVLDKMSEPVGLIILGQGELRSYLEQIKKEKDLKYLFIEGFIAPEELAKYYTVADLFLLLSRYDCNPLVIFEALSCGLPIVCSERVGNAPDFINNDNGFVGRLEALDELAEKIAEILGDESIRTEMGIASLRKSRAANYEDSAASFVKMSRCIKNHNR
jgi:glycosyltransferase involved in cell wall biosynthesis